MSPQLGSQTLQNVCFSVFEVILGSRFGLGIPQ
jgi:hypothetical protein